MIAHRRVVLLALVLALPACARKGDRTASTGSPSAPSVQQDSPPDAAAPEVEDAGNFSVSGSIALDPGPAVDTPPDPLVGKPAPELVLKGVAKKPAPTLRGLRGKVVVVHFFASWCAPCEKSFPSFQAVADRNPGVVVVGVSADDAASDVAPFLEKTKSKFAVGWDDHHKTAKAYAVAMMPATYLVDQKGIVRYGEAGYRETSDKALEAAIGKLK